jgi:hypothetical protein
MGYGFAAQTHTNRFELYFFQRRKCKYNKSAFCLIIFVSNRKKSLQKSEKIVTH